VVAAVDVEDLAGDAADVGLRRNRAGSARMVGSAVSHWTDARIELSLTTSLS
jgi:hypothetical protein